MNKVVPEKKITDRIVENWEKLEGTLNSHFTPPPRLLMLEVNNACNLKCIMCNNPNMVRKIGTMPVELGLKAIGEAAAFGIKEVALFTVGEPLIYRHLEELIHETKKHKLYCFLTSNGQLLNEKTAEMLCKSGLDSFKFSIDGSNKEEYEDIRIKGKFKKLLRNVKLMKTVRDRTGSKMKITCATVLMNRNRNSTKEFKKLFTPLADSILISEMNNLGGKIQTENMLVEKNVVKSPCRLLWDRIVICYDGKITACCVDFDAELTYDDYNRTSISEAWNNQTLQNWRLSHLKGDVSDIPLCKDCTAPYYFDIDRFKSLQK